MKNLSMTKLDKAIKAAAAKSATVSIMKNDEESIDVEVRHTISLAEMSQLVQTATDNLFVEYEDGYVEYKPELEEISIAANVLAYYTNLKDDLDNDRLVSLVYGTNIYETICAHIDSRQLDRINWAVVDLTRHRLEEVRNAQRAAIAKATAQIEAAGEAFRVLNEQFEAVGPDMLKALIEKFESADTDQIIKAVVASHDNVTPIR